MGGITLHGRMNVFALRPSPDALCSGRLRAGPLSGGARSGWLSLRLSPGFQDRLGKRCEQSLDTATNLSHNLRILGCDVVALIRIEIEIVELDRSERKVLSAALRRCGIDGRSVACDMELPVLPSSALQIRRLCTIPGVDFTTAAVILAEVGFDMTRFADAAQLASWAGLCPGNNESAGKRFSSRTRKGNRYLRRVLTQSAWSITHKKNCFLTGIFYRVASRGGMKKAAIAVAHRILTIAWHIIAEGSTYYELEGNGGDRQQTASIARRLARRLEQLGFEVEIKSKTNAQPPPPPFPPSPQTPRLTTSPTDPVVCRRCARWGIPCIHAKNVRRVRSATPALLTNQRLR